MELIYIIKEYELKNQMIKTYVYWHICILNNWMDIVRDQAAHLEAKLDYFDEIRICVLGDENAIPLIMDLLSGKVILRGHDTEINKFEAFTLEALLEDAKKEDFKCIYLHNKGTTQQGNKCANNVNRWRKMMEFFLIDNCEKCIPLLEYYDTLGCNLLDKGNISGETVRFADEIHSLHYSGNFWWARSDYISRLPPFPVGLEMDKNNNYWICERWVLQQAPNIRLCTLYSEKYKHFYTRHPNPGYNNHVGTYSAVGDSVKIEIRWNKEVFKSYQSSSL